MSEHPKAVAADENDTDSLSTNDQKELWRLRTSACELLAFSLRYPTEELFGAIQSGEWQAAAEEIWNLLGMDLEPNWAQNIEQSDFHALRSESTRLFVGSPTPVCSPYEGYWCAQEEGVAALLFVNPHSMEVERFCLMCGLGNPEGANDPLDAIATEMELLQYLASLAAGIASPVETSPALDELPGGSAEAAYGRFISEHTATFAPKLAQCIVESTDMPYFQAVAKLLSSYFASPQATCS